MLLNQVFDNMPGMSTVGGKPHTAGEKHHHCLLTGYVNTAGSSLSGGEVALAVGAETAQIAERRIPRCIRLHEPHIPVSQSSDVRHWRSADRLPLVFCPYDLLDFLAFLGLLLFRCFRHFLPLFDGIFYQLKCLGMP